MTEINLGSFKGDQGEKGEFGGYYFPVINDDNPSILTFEYSSTKPDETPSIDITRIKGDPGPIGNQGPKGDQGDKGDPGINGKNLHIEKCTSLEEVEKQDYYLYLLVDNSSENNYNAKLYAWDKNDDKFYNVSEKLIDFSITDIINTILNNNNFKYEVSTLVYKCIENILITDYPLDEGATA